MSPLVSDGSVNTPTQDAKLINPWGIVFGDGTPVWVANNATGSATLYDGTGIKIPLEVTLPGGANGDADATGIVANSTSDFVVTNGTTSAPARFIFDGESGMILGWAPSVDQSNAIIVYTDTGGAVYKGLTMAADGGANFLYATDFHNNKVDVFDKSFQKVTVAGGFTDPTLPEHYAPFGIQAVTSNGTTVIYVTYAQTVAGSNDNANGAGLGLVNVFDTKGNLLKHLVPTGGALNAPWGVALAPATGFGTLSGTLLIGNFGDGVINAYNPDTGAFVDSVKDAAGQPIANAGLWGMAFGNGARNQPTTTLYFAAGISNEAGGLYGRIDLGATPPDVVAPTVTLSAPAANATVSGSVAVTADAADNVGVTSVKFLAGTTTIGTATAAPFTINWDTTGTANGAVSLTAQAQDAAGNVTTSPAVSVTVSNTAPSVTLSQLQTAIFTPRCAFCHNGSGVALPGVMNLSSAAATFAALVNVQSINEPTLKRVLPGDPDNSYIIHKLEGTNLGTTSRMPLGGPFLDQPTIEMVRAWITAGAQNN
ncbi:MAG TPA: TIGR03118 family protein [Steroidobacteraceae bacterium]|nr:TIGR03118 family protein [Steroidobacteraceae bacterium]